MTEYWLQRLQVANMTRAGVVSTKQVDPAAGLLSIPQDVRDGMQFRLD